ncbi:PP2C family protein-serine/threonine phosphatase [Candidatus Viridilinea mediisalina]|uniref:Stage II sporulation protein E n=1 Tax=Candidatus Viridilinea mediisalina TaxID=2024553 RepID=A0A2A6RGW8_9CHLR|nr:GAF domain-containing SpoIIE family protein phosphatase [Candidatus Viridilinea mediisalina]PDW02374.1 stage II sporulation protein E [Candidatus Viridilinea mediisalina]
MLVALLSSQYARFKALADAWIAMGATAFGVSQEDYLLAYWPAGHLLARPSLRAPIMLEDEELGELRVAGLHGLMYEQRLRADATMLAYTLQLERELQQMTADLVTSQDQQVALYRLTQTMRDHLTVEETLRAVVSEAMRMIKAQHGYAMYVPVDAQTALLVQLPGPSLQPELLWQLFWQAQANEQDQHVVDVALETTGDPTTCQILHLPIKVRGAYLAGMGLASTTSEFSAPDKKLLRAIADQASVQIERTLLYKEMFDQAKLRTEMDLARRVQLDLLPRNLPHIAGLDIYAASRPAYEVGGDFYDFIIQEGRPFMFVTGDVTGKGLSAALLMTMTRSAIHSKARFMPYPTPESVMRQSNEDLYSDFTRVGVFATAFIGQYDTKDHTLTYANAGHSPVIYQPYDAEPILLRADGTAIGVLAINYSRNQRLRLRPGDLLVVATDGFSDMRGADDESFGIERLLTLVTALRTRSAEGIAAGMFEALDQFGQGRSQDDDQTLIVMKRQIS